MAFRSVAQLIQGRFNSVSEFLDFLRKERAYHHTAARTGENPLTREIDTEPERFDAPTRLQAASRQYFVGTPYLKQQSRADWQHCPRAIQEFGARLVLEMRRRQIPMFVHCAYRSPAEQTAAVKRGVSKAYPQAAPHCRGAAVDVIHSIFAWEMNKSEWDYIGKIGKEIADKMGIDIEWGGDWKFYDPAHFELVGWRDLPGPYEPHDPINKTPHAIKAEGWTYQKGYQNKGNATS